MSTLWIEEWGGAVYGSNGQLMDVPRDFIGQTQVTISGVSARTSFDFDARTRYVVAYVDADTYILFGGSAVVADQNSVIMPGGVFRTFGIDAGDTRVAGIAKA